MPRIATSGQLTIGVKQVPPMPPRFVIVKPPPCISSSDSLPARLLGQLGELDGEISMMPFRSTSRITGTSRPRLGVDRHADVARILKTISSRGVDRRVELRELLSADARTFSVIAVIVSLPPAASACGPNFWRSASRSVMSALSLCVTCGTVVHAVARCSAVLRRMAPSAGARPRPTC